MQLSEQIGRISSGSTSTAAAETSMSPVRHSSCPQPLPPSDGKFRFPVKILLEMETGILEYKWNKFGILEYLEFGILMEYGNLFRN